MSYSDDWMLDFLYRVFSHPTFWFLVFGGSLCCIVLLWFELQMKKRKDENA